MDEKVGGKIACPFPRTLEVFIRIQLSESHIKKTKKKSTEFPKTASQNADHVLPSDSSLLICSPYLGSFLRLPFINMATWGPVVERLCSKWTTDPSDRIVHEYIVFFFLLTAEFLSSLYLSIVSYLLRYLSLSVLTSMLYFVSPLKPTPMSLVLNIAPLLHLWSAVYLYLYGIRLLTLHWELVSWSRSFPREHVQRGELLLITIWDDPSKGYYEG